MFNLLLRIFILIQIIIIIFFLYKLFVIKNYLYYSIYIIIIIFFISIELIFIRLKNEKIFIIYSLSLLAGIYLFEIYNFAKNKYFINLNNLENLSKVDYYGAHIDNGYKVYLPVPNMNIEGIFALSNISNAELIDCNENGYYSRVKTDRYGFNNLDKNWDEDKIDYLMIGDSFLWGSCVSSENSIPYKLKEYSKKLKILALAKGGSGPLTQYAYLIEYAKNIKADNLVWFFYLGNDINNLKNELENKFLLKYLKNNYSQNLINKQNIIDKKFKEEIESKYKEYLSRQRNNFQIILDILKIKKTREIIFSLFNFKNSQTDISSLSIEINKIDENKLNKNENLNNNLEGLINIANLIYNFSITNNAQPYFVLIPNRIDYNDKLLAQEILIKMNDIGFNVIDLQEAIKGNKKYYSGNNTHFNKYGYSSVSKYLFQKIID